MSGNTFGNVLKSLACVAAARTVVDVLHRSCYKGAHGEFKDSEYKLFSYGVTKAALDQISIAGTMHYAGAAMTGAVIGYAGAQSMAATACCTVLALGITRGIIAPAVNNFALTISNGFGNTKGFSFPTGLLDGSCLVRQTAKYAVKASPAGAWPYHLGSVAAGAVNSAIGQFQGKGFVNLFHSLCEGVSLSMYGWTSTATTALGTALGATSGAMCAAKIAFGMLIEGLTTYISPSRGGNPNNIIDDAQKLPGVVQIC